MGENKSMDISDLPEDVAEGLSLIARDMVGYLSRLGNPVTANFSFQYREDGNWIHLEYTHEREGMYHCNVTVNRSPDSTEGDMS